MTRRPLAVAVAAALGVTGFGALVAPAAGAAPALRLTSSAPVAVVRNAVTFRVPAQPAHLASWTLAFGDGTTTTGTGLVPAVRHTYRTTRPATVRLTVRTASGATASASLREIVSPLAGTLVSGRVPLRGVLVSVADANSTADVTPTLARVRTDAHGFWYLPPSTRQPGGDGYSVVLNADAGGKDLPEVLRSSNNRFGIGVDTVKPGHAQLRTDLPPVTWVHGTVVPMPGQSLANVGVEAVSLGALTGQGLFAAALVDAQGNYTIALGRGQRFLLLPTTLTGDSDTLNADPVVIGPIGVTSHDVPPIVLTATKGSS